MLSGRETLIEDKTTDPLFMKVGANYYFYHTDHLGTPQKMTAVNGAAVWSAKYSSFGKATVDAASTVTNPLRFPGQYFDAETGLHYNYHRYFDPKTGRYLKPDPIGLVGGFNLYTYTKNSPDSSIDPFGLREICLPAVSSRSEWEYHSRSVEWEFTGAQTSALHQGMAGICHYSKVERGWKTRKVTPVKLCFDTCEKSLFYRFDLSQSITEHEEYEKEIEKRDLPSVWFPVDGVIWAQVCQPPKD